jgi:hypothetical protein
MPVTSVTNVKGDNEMIPGDVHRSPGICLTAKENPGKPQLGDCLMKGLYGQSLPQMGSLAFKWGSLPSHEVGRTAQHSTSRKEKGGKKERTGSISL